MPRTTSQVFGHHIGSPKLEFVPAHQIAPDDPEAAWLIQAIWAKNGVGIVGGPPKGRKSFLTLDAAISVASRTPFLGSFAVSGPGKVMIISMEGTLGLLRHRLDRIAASRELKLDDLPIQVCTAPGLHLDDPLSYLALEQSVRIEGPTLLIIDPFVRVFRGDEDDAGAVSLVLGKLTRLQREFRTAIMLVHHAKKGVSTTTGQTLRGSGDLHAWGDSNLYLSRDGDNSTRVTVEHRATESGEGFRFTVVEGVPTLDDGATAEGGRDSDEPLRTRILRVLEAGPLGLSGIQEQVGVRRATVSAELQAMAETGEIAADGRKWRLQAA